MHSLGSESTVQDRLDYLSLVCANPSDGLSAGLWCEAANEGLMLARSLFEQLEALEHLRDLCLQYMNAKEGEEDERQDAIFDYVASGLTHNPASEPDA